MEISEELQSRIDSLEAEHNEALAREKVEFVMYSI